MRVLVAGGGAADRDILRALGFSNVTMSNMADAGSETYAPYRFDLQDLEALTYENSAFDWAIVSAALHHCRSPHRALLELYRVARRGVLALESRDSAAIRLAARLGVIDPYELTAVAAGDFRAGGVRNTGVPNYVYRWTEREVEKTIASYAPETSHHFMYFRGARVAAVDLRRRRPAASSGGASCAQCIRFSGRWRTSCHGRGTCSRSSSSSPRFRAPCSHGSDSRMGKSSPTKHGSAVGSA